MTEYPLFNLNGSVMGWVVLTSNGFRYIQNRISSEAATAIIKALKELDK